MNRLAKHYINYVHTGSTCLHSGIYMISIQAMRCTIKPIPATSSSVQGISLDITPCTNEGLATSDYDNLYTYSTGLELTISISSYCYPCSAVLIATIDEYVCLFYHLEFIFEIISLIKHSRPFSWNFSAHKIFLK